MNNALLNLINTKTKLSLPPMSKIKTALIARSKQIHSAGIKTHNQQFTNKKEKFEMRMDELSEVLKNSPWVLFEAERDIPTETEPFLINCFKTEEEASKAMRQRAEEYPQMDLFIAKVHEICFTTRSFEKLE